MTQYFVLPTLSQRVLNSDKFIVCSIFRHLTIKLVYNAANHSFYQVMHIVQGSVFLC